VHLLLSYWYSTVKNVGVTWPWPLDRVHLAEIINCCLITSNWLSVTLMYQISVRRRPPQFHRWQTSVWRTYCWVMMKTRQWRRR